MKLNDKELAMLESLFVQDLPGEKPHFTFRGHAAEKSLGEKGLIEPAGFVFGRDALGPIVVRGYRLTIKGHIAYCEAASKMVDQEHTVVHSEAVRVGEAS